ncbi:hypothetical protein PLICRDRAFT_316886 [Plicaturopsis crispa FD-325 SS-3]|nr:hypothetical protein PLICRDRAFT_316886 [Plicaturopsis crispa FD-325 SS-3]
MILWAVLTDCWFGTACTLYSPVVAITNLLRWISSNNGPAFFDHVLRLRVCDRRPPAGGHCLSRYQKALAILQPPSTWVELDSDCTPWRVPAETSFGCSEHKVADCYRIGP